MVLYALDIIWLSKYIYMTNKKQLKEHREVVALFSVLLDDRLRTRNGPSSIRTVPPAAAALLKRRIKSDDFDFGGILYNGVPLILYPTKRNILKMLGSFFSASKNATKHVPAEFLSTKLIEGASGKWRVELRWEVSIPEGREVDLNELRREIEGQLSDGWGEGVEQFRFGPVVDCDDYELCIQPKTAARKRELEKLVDLNGRFSFNLAIERILLVSH